MLESAKEFVKKFFQNAVFSCVPAALCFVRGPFHFLRSTVVCLIADRQTKTECIFLMAARKKGKLPCS